MRRWANRLLVVLAVTAAAYAGVFAVHQALHHAGAGVAVAKAADTRTSASSVPFGDGRVVTRVRSSGLSCFVVLKGSSTVARSCFSPLAADAIAVAASRVAVGGRAGSDVRAVIVRLTHGGTVWASLRRGAFYAAVPAGHRPLRVVKVVRGGARTTFRLAS